MLLLHKIKVPSVCVFDGYILSSWKDYVFRFHASCLFWKELDFTVQSFCLCNIVIVVKTCE